MKRVFAILTVALFAAVSVCCVSAERITEVYNVTITQTVEVPNSESSVDFQSNINHVIGEAESDSESAADGTPDAETNNAAGDNSAQTNRAEGTDNEGATDGKKGGCRSVIGGGAIVSVTILALSASILRKRKK